MPQPQGAVSDVGPEHVTLLLEAKPEVVSFHFGRANVSASRLRSRANVSAAIQQAKVERAKRAGVTQEQIIRELVKLGFYDARKACKWSENDVELVPSDQIDNDTAAAVIGLTQKVAKNGSRTVTLKLADKCAALVELGRHLGIFEHNSRVSENVTIKSEDDAAL